MLQEFITVLVLDCLEIKQATFPTEIDLLLHLSLASIQFAKVDFSLLGDATNEFEVLR